MVINKLDETKEVRLTKLEGNGKPFIVIQGGEPPVPTFMIFQSDWGCADDGDGESGPMPYQYEKPYVQVSEGIGGSPDPEKILADYLAEDERARAEQPHVHEYDWRRSCGAKVCGDCGDHDGLARCYCGWSAGGGDGYAELVEMGEQIEEDY